MSTANIKIHKLAACLWFNDQAEEVARFYTSNLPHGVILGHSTYPESFDAPGGHPRGSVLTVEFEAGGQRFTALNGGPVFTVNPSISFFVHVDSADETDALATRLVAGGHFSMPPERYPFSERYAWVVDRYGVSWQVFAGQHAAHVQRVAPCLMFANAVHGRAEEAMRAYVDIFPGSAIDRIERYGADRGPEGKVVHGRLTLAGSQLIVMDSHEPSGATFNEGVSLEVPCRDQAEVDHYWRRLSAGGKEGPCGWVTDRFGVSWQIVPASLAAWLQSTDVEARDRTFAAMLHMSKLDVAGLEAAFRG